MTTTSKHTHDRASRTLRAAYKRLRRLAKRRSSASAKAAYREAIALFEKRFRRELGLSH